MMKRFLQNYDLSLTIVVTLFALAMLVNLYFVVGALADKKLIYFFPKIAFWIVLVPGIFGIISTYYLKYNKPGEKKDEQETEINILAEDEQQDLYPEVNFLSVALFLTLAIMYILCLQSIGIIVGTFLFLLLSFIILSTRNEINWKVVIVYPCLFTFLIWFIFIRLFNLVFSDTLLF